MSDFQLDVDSPYPLPTRKDVMVKPRKMNYTQSHIPYKHYGKYVGFMLKRLGREQNQANVSAAVDNIARFMRTKSYEYNQEHPNNEVIIKDIKRMSDFAIELDEVALNNLRSEYKQHHSSYSQQSKNGKKPVKNGKIMQRPMQKGRPKGVMRHNTAK